MGTRSLTTFIETYKGEDGKVKKVKLATMYRQMDGYPSGHGTELADFLKNTELVNGFAPMGKPKKPQFNGMGCLGASVITHFKTGIGSFYLVNGINHGEEFRYEIEGSFGSPDITLRCLEVGYMRGTKYMRGTRKLFEGTPKDFNKWLVKYEKHHNV